MGFQPMACCTRHASAQPKQQSRKRESVERPTLSRLLNGCAVCVSTRTMGWKPMLREESRHDPRHLDVRIAPSTLSEECHRQFGIADERAQDPAHLDADEGVEH